MFSPCSHDNPEINEKITYVMLIVVSYLKKTVRNLEKYFK